jgi:hypothetical protein
MADLEHASENDNDLHGDKDAMHWAERFASRFTVQRKNGESVDTLGLMLAWFSGAIETGKMHDLDLIVAYKAFGSIYDPKDVTIVRAQRPE